MPRPPITAYLAARFAPLLLAACGSSPTPGPNVLLITVDTLRADHVGAWGYERPTTPTIDALAARGLRFARATAPAPWTLPSVASLNTGLSPLTHSLQSPNDTLPIEAVTLAEILQSRGYTTAGVVSNTLLKPRMGHAQGFDSFYLDEQSDHASISTPEVTAHAKELLAGFASSGEPFFLSLLYFDPHYDWRSHGLGFAAPSAGRIEDNMTIEELRDLAASGGLSAEECELLVARYDEEIRFTDAGIAELLNELARLGLAEDTLVVFVADHGEEFLEHGWLGHTRFLFDGMLHVPLIVLDPRPDALHGAIVEARVSTISVTPTILDLLDINPAPWAFDAPSLAPAVRGAELVEQPIFSMVNFEAQQRRHLAKSAHLESMILGDTKYIRPSRQKRGARRGGSLQRYDLRADPNELAPTVLRRDTPEAQAAERLLDEAIAHFRVRALPHRTAAYSEAELDQLQRLGYLGDE